MDRFEDSARESKVFLRVFFVICLTTWFYMCIMQDIGWTIQQHPCCWEARMTCANDHDVLVYISFIHHFDNVLEILSLQKLIWKKQSVSSLDHYREPLEKLGVQFLPPPMIYDHSLTPELNLSVASAHLHKFTRSTAARPTIEHDPDFSSSCSGHYFAVWE